MNNNTHQSSTSLTGNSIHSQQPPGSSSRQSSSLNQIGSITNSTSHPSNRTASQQHYVTHQGPIRIQTSYSSRPTHTIYPIIHSVSNISLSSTAGPTSNIVSSPIVSANNGDGNITNSMNTSSVFQMEPFSASTGSKRRHSAGPHVHKSNDKSNTISSFPVAPVKDAAKENLKTAEFPLNRSYFLDGPLNALSNSPDREHAVVAGRDVFKILQVPNGSPGTIREAFNFRLGASLKMNATINDVKWSHHQTTNSIILTCGTDGAITVWDLNRSTPDKVDRILSDHRRAVNRISFHHSDGNMFLSASQDGSVKLWDLRTKGMARASFEGKAESARDVLFNPTSPYEFATAFENGNIQLWDIRLTAQCKRKWNAHNGLTLSADWSPDGRYIVSGGRDRFIKLWDTKSESRKPAHSIQTISPVAFVRWRMGYDTQLAYASLSSDFRIHVWDIRRPFVAQHWLEDHENVVTGFLWHSSDSIWSCSKDRKFVCQHVRSGSVPTSYLSSSAISWNPVGHVTYALEYRRSKLPSIEFPAATDVSGKSFSAVVGSVSSSYASQTTNSFPGFGSSSGKNASSSQTQKRFLAASEASSSLTTVPATDDKLKKFRPCQVLGTFDFDDMDPNRVAVLATKLILDPCDIDEACLLNAQSCRDCGLITTAEIWNMVRVLFGKETPLSTNLTQWFKDNVTSIHSVIPDPDERSISEYTPNSFSSKVSLEQRTVTSGQLLDPEDDDDDKDTNPDGSFDDNDSVISRSKSIQNTEDDDEEEDYDDDQDYDNAASLDSESEDSGTSSDESNSPKLGTLKPIRRTERTSLGRKYAFMSSILQRVPMLKVKPSRPSKMRKTVLKLKAPDVMTRTLNRELIMEDIFNFLSHRGDMQTCVAISLLLKDKLRVPISRMTEWFYSYIDLLYRLELPAAAAYIISLSHIEAIQVMNQQSTLIHGMCGTCQKPIEINGNPSASKSASGWACESCKSHAVICSLCRVPVQGMTMWCHGCAHGGHVKCLELWYSENVECPSGCGHTCIPKRQGEARITPSASIVTL